MIGLRSITGKYFIQKEPQPSGDSGLVMRGRILGVIEGTENSLPIYLCELWPANDDELDVRTETPMALPQLLNAWLYDDRALFVEAWRKLIVDSKKAEQAARRQAAAAEKKAREQFAEAIRGAASGAGGAAVRQVELPDGRKIVMLDPFAGPSEGEVE